MLGSQWFLVLAENQLRLLYYSTFPLSETQPEVVRNNQLKFR